MRVLHTVAPSDRLTNPFVNLMIGSLPESVRSSFFSWRRALLGRYDLIHFQWPEKLVTSDSKPRLVLKLLMMHAMLARAAARKTAVVVTIHNLEAHEQVSRGGRRVLRRLERMTDHTILLNGSQQLHPQRGTVSVIPHGHYLETIRTHEATRESPDRLLFFGLIRAYKGVSGLVSAYRESDLENHGVTLDVVGEPWDDAQRVELETQVAGSRRISTRLQSVPEDELHSRILDAGLIVLPYRKLYNSGAILLALSLQRPVLVPQCAAALELQREFGASWILTYEGELDGAKLTESFSTYRAQTDSRTPLDLSSRDWATLGLKYLDAYRVAIAHRGGEHVSPGSAVAE